MGRTMGRLFGARRDTLATDDGRQQLLGDSRRKEGRKSRSHVGGRLVIATQVKYTKK